MGLHGHSRGVHGRPIWHVGLLGQGPSLETGLVLRGVIRQAGFLWEGLNSTTTGSTIDIGIGRVLKGDRGIRIQGRL